MSESLASERATSASAWKRPAIELVTLPSGNVAKLRRPQIIPMLQRGDIPNPLVGAALSLSGEAPMTETDVDPKDAISFMCWVVSQAFVEPVVVVVGEDASAGQIPRDKVPAGALVLGDDLLDEDIQFVTTWWESGAATFDTFREERPGDPDRADGEQVLDEAVAATRD